MNTTTTTTTRTGTMHFVAASPMTLDIIPDMTDFVHGKMGIERYALQAALKSAGIKQAEIGSIAGVSQATASRGLRSNPLSDDVVRAVRDLLDMNPAATDVVRTWKIDNFRRSMYDRIVNGIAGAVPCITNPGNGEHETGPFGDRSYFATLGIPTAATTGTPSAPGPDPDPIPAPPATPAPVVRDGFDVDAALQVRGIVQRAIEQETTDVTFGGRKLGNWARAYAAFRNHDFRHDVALATAYDVAVSAREYGAERIFLLESFASVFTTPGPDDVTLPDLPPDPDGAILHPLLAILRPLLDAPSSDEHGPMHVYIAGETGCGKSRAVSDEFQRRTSNGQDAIYLNMNSGMRVGHIVGTTGYDSSVGTIFKSGPLPISMTTGIPLVVEEIEASDPGILAVFQRVLEGKNLLIPEDGARVVEPTGDFRIVATGNSVGLGEATKYTGLTVLNESFRDRFVFIRAGELPQDAQAEILRRMFADVPQYLADDS